MKVFRINYTADKKKYSMIMTAKNERDAKKKCKSFFKKNDFTETSIDLIREIF